MDEGGAGTKWKRESMAGIIMRNDGIAVHVHQFEWVPNRTKTAINEYLRRRSQATKVQTGCAETFAFMPGPVRKNHRIYER